MVNKKIWLEMLAIVLVFGMTVVGCDDEDSSSVIVINLPEVYQNTTWVNTPPEEGDYYADDYYNNYTKITFGVTFATLFRDKGAITDNTGKKFNVKEVGPNNYYTNQLKTNVSQIIMDEYVPPPSTSGGSSGGENPSPSPSIDRIYVFVKDDGNGIYVTRNSGGSFGTNWVKQK